MEPKPIDGGGKMHEPHPPAIAVFTPKGDLCPVISYGDDYTSTDDDDEPHQCNGCISLHVELARLLPQGVDGHNYLDIMPDANVGRVIEACARFLQGNTLFSRRSTMSGAPIGQLLSVSGTTCTVSASTHKEWGHIVTKSIARRNADVANAEVAALRVIERHCESDDSWRFPKVFAYVEYRADNRLEISMSRVFGTTIREAIARPPSSEEIRSLCGAAVKSLKIMHAALVTHGDISPGNVMLENGTWNRPVFIDFGIGRVNDRHGATTPFVMGAPAFMAPETFSASEIDTFAADVWSLGVLLYYAATGKLPWDTLPAPTSRRAPTFPYATEDCEINDLAEFPGLSAFLRKMIRRNPKERYSPSRLYRYPYISRHNSTGSTSTNTESQPVSDKSVFSKQSEASTASRLNDQSMNNLGDLSTSMEASTENDTIGGSPRATARPSSSPMYVALQPINSGLMPTALLEHVKKAEVPSRSPTGDKT